FDLFKISPIIGIANGNIVFYSEEYLNGTLKYSYHNNDLHNGYLTIIVSTGVLGALLFGTFGFRFAKHAAQHLFLRRKTVRTEIYPCLFAFLGAYLVYALFEKALLYDISFMVMWFWLMMGYTSCYVAKYEHLIETQYLFHQKRIRRTML
ncbi:MAG: O-antigen ligase family protein, partial [Ruminococcus sp.]|nr:O-antigen ligase family protein [Ruminococcus sp.]